MWLCGLHLCYTLRPLQPIMLFHKNFAFNQRIDGFIMIFIEFYNDIHRKCINIGLPTDPWVEDRVLVKQHYLR